MRKHVAWENICKRCGRCCFEKVEFEGEIYYTDQPCPHLDVKTRLCRDYDRRHQVKPDCTPLTPRIVAMGVLPADCPYVKDQKDYQGPRMWDEDDT